MESATPEKLWHHLLKNEQRELSLQVQLSAGFLTNGNIHAFKGISGFGETGICRPEIGSFSTLNSFSAETGDDMNKCGFCVVSSGPSVFGRPVRLNEPADSEPPKPEVRIPVLLTGIRRVGGSTDVHAKSMCTLQSSSPLAFREGPDVLRCGSGRPSALAC